MAKASQVVLIPEIKICPEAREMTKRLKGIFNVKKP